MSEIGKCAICGAPLRPSVFGNRCPRCLLAIGLEEEDSEAEPVIESGHHGRRLGDYELVEEIACGGMGIIYKARQISLNRTVAVKMLLAGSFAVSEFVQRFRTEAEAAASLHHRNIVPIHEFGRADGQYYLVMDYVEGQNLGQLIRQQPLPPRQAAEYLKTIAEAVHYAHQQGILHRDLKPTNILVDRNNEVHITDFGLAKRLASESDITITGQTIGSPTYSAPEQVLGKHKEVGPHSDVYSLGAMLYEMLTGRPPFVGDSITAVIHQVQEKEVVSPRLLNPGVPRDLESICLKCLEKEWRKRYVTAGALAADLGRFLRGEATDARPIQMWGRAQRWCKRKPVIATLAATSVLVFLLGFAGVFWQWRQTKHEASRATEVLALMRQMFNAEQAFPTRGRDLTVRQMLDEFSESITNRLAGEPEIEAEVRDILAIAYWGLSLPESALPHRQRALELQRKIYGDHHLKVARSLHQYAGIVKLMGLTNGLAQAERLMSEALEIALAESPGSQVVPQALSERAMIRLARGNLTGAKADIEQVWSKQNEPDWHPLMVAGSIALQMGDPDEAERLYRAALDAQKDVSGPIRGWALGELGMLASRRGRHAEAELLLREAMTNYIWQSGFEDGSLGLAWPLYNVLQAQGKRDPELEPVFCHAAIRWSNSPDRPTVSYRVKVQTVGKYRLYLRWDGLGSQGHTVWAKVCELGDGPQGSVADVYRFDVKEVADADFATIDPWQGEASFEKFAQGEPTVPVTWEIPRPGVYTLRFVMIDAGCALDAFILQLDELPAPTGDGPTESDRTAEGTFLESGGSVVGEAEHFSERSRGKDVAWRVVPEEDAGHVDYLNWRGDGYLQALPDLRTDAIEKLRAAGTFVKAARGDYAGALHGFQEVVQQAPGDLRSHYLVALLQLRLGKVAAYRETCQQMIKLCEQAGPGADTWYAIWASALWPEATKNPERLVAWAEEGSRLKADDLNVWMRLGTALYRSQVYDRATHALQQAHELWDKAELKPNDPSPAYLWYFLAMTHQRLGHQEEAQTWFRRAVKWTNKEIQGLPGTDWNRKLTLELLRTEAAQVLGINETITNQATTAIPQ